MEIKKRGPGRLKSDYVLRDAYKHYVSITEVGLRVDLKTYIKVCLEANQLISNEILDSSETIKLPARMGHLSIKKSKLQLGYTKLMVDWKSSNLIGKRVYHLNDHRQGYKYRFYWVKRDCNAANKTAYSFTPARTLKRRLAHILKNEPQIDYYE
jgi:hypothetical protein